VCPLVLAVFPQLPGFGGNNGRAWPRVDHVTIWRWVQRFAPILNQRLRRELRRPNRSWRVDETYVRFAGQWTYLYRAVDSAGDTIDFMLSAKRDLTAAKLFLRLALSGSGGVRPRGCERGWASRLQSRHCGVKGFARSRSALLVPPFTLFEQHHRARPPLHQKAHHGEPWIPFARRRMEDDRRLRGDAYDSERAGPMVGKGRCDRAAPIYSQPLWHRSVGLRRLILAARRRSAICNRTGNLYWTEGPAKAQYQQACHKCAWFF
jgi:hypothetical protein